VKRDYAAIAEQYAREVVAGTILACRWTIDACRRQLADLERAETPAFPYRYEPARGARVCFFIELLKHIKGKWARQPIRLEAWQIFVVMTVFSWVWATDAHADPEIAARDGFRRFRTSYLEVPRKNAKSTLTSGIGLYMLALDGEGGAECYSAATTRDQAKIVWSDARTMALRSPEFCNRFGVEVLAHAITIDETSSKFIPLAAEDGSLDGLNVHFACNDELHAHKTRGLYDVLETATGSRTQSLIWNITTAGSNRAGICYEQRTYLTKILQGVAQDESFFGIIYTIDDEDDWTDPTVWAKANPNYGVSVFPDDIARLCRKAQEMPSAQGNFLTKRLDVWVNADTTWMDMRAWDRCADKDLAIEQFEGERCIDGLDLASKVDIAAKVRVFSRLVDGNRHFYAFGRYYLPESAAEESGNSQYPGWIETGGSSPRPATSSISTRSSRSSARTRAFRARRSGVRPLPGDAALDAADRGRLHDGRNAPDRAQLLRADEGARGARALGALPSRRRSGARLDGEQRRLPSRPEGQHLPAERAGREQDRRRRRADHGARPLDHAAGSRRLRVRDPRRAGALMRRASRGSGRSFPTCPTARLAGAGVLVRDRARLRAGGVDRRRSPRPRRRRAACAKERRR
jgi:phage terminase large subunit-like protein